MTMTEKYYYIKWTRCTGETGRFSTNYFNKAKAERALKIVQSIDRTGKEYRYEIVEREMTSRVAEINILTK